VQISLRFMDIVKEKNPELGYTMVKFSVICNLLIISEINNVTVHIATVMFYPIHLHSLKDTKLVKIFSLLVTEWKRFQ